MNTIITYVAATYVHMYVHIQWLFIYSSMYVQIGLTYMYVHTYVASSEAIGSYAIKYGYVQII